MYVTAQQATDEFRPGEVTATCRALMLMCQLAQEKLPAARDSEPVAHFMGVAENHFKDQLKVGETPSG